MVGSGVWGNGAAADGGRRAKSPCCARASWGKIWGVLARHREVARGGAKRWAHAAVSRGEGLEHGLRVIRARGEGGVGGFTPVQARGGL